MLGHSHHGVVHRTVAVWVILSKHLPHNPCGLLVGPVGQHTQIQHPIQHSAVDGLQAVSHIGKCTTHDYRHRVVDVSRFHLV